MTLSSTPIRRPDFSAFSAAAPGKTLDLLFIHHSCGGQWLAAPGPNVDEDRNAIYKTHTNAGDLRAKLENNGYRVHEAAYGSRVGDKTDIFDWLPKFRTQMEEIFMCAQQDERLSGGQRNRIVVFKSCYPNNAFVAEGQPPGDPAGPRLTLWNARASYAALLPEFQKHPDVLFVCVTAPPLAPHANADVAWKRWIKKWLGRYQDPAESARIAREFNNWLSAKNGWLAGYRQKNVVVFDYYDILTGDGAANCSAYSTGNGFDSHPSTVGNSRATEVFLPFINRAVRRAALIE